MRKNFRLRDIKYKSFEEYYRFLKKLGKKINKTEKLEWGRATALGGFREVGRSALLIETNSSKILLDCGIEVGGKDLYPYLNLFQS